MVGGAKTRLGMLLAASLCTGACGEAEADPSIAQAMETKSDMQVAAAAVSDKKRAEAKEAKAAAEAQAAARAAEIKAAATLPTTMPKSLEKACDAFVESFDQFMLAGAEKDVLRWWDGHRKKLGERRSNCLLRKSVEVAACGTQALAAPLPSLEGMPRRDAAREVVQACIDAYGGET
ncbi:MAG: hypothetical protein AAGA54_10895 [Myxococcota bacterium]